MPEESRWEVARVVRSARRELEAVARTRSLDELRARVRLKVRASPAYRRAVVDRFHTLFYSDGTWRDTYFLGVGVLKNPLDLWIYQELVQRLRPDLIIETGTMFGGSAFFLATMCELVGNGRVVTIDITERPGRPEHPRLSYRTGSSTDEAIVAEMAELAAAGGTTMVILDSDHSRDHVLAELRAYAPLVTPGSYVVVEDSNVNGHPVWPTFGPGPMEAIDQFLAENDQFEIDAACEKFMFTLNPRGYLRRRGPVPGAAGAARGGGATTTGATSRRATETSARTVETAGAARGAGSTRTDEVEGAVGAAPAAGGGAGRT